MEQKYICIKKKDFQFVKMFTLTVIKFEDFITRNVV